MIDAPGNGALQGVEHKGVDADPCHPGTLPGWPLIICPLVGLTCAGIGTLIR